MDQDSAVSSEDLDGDHLSGTKPPQWLIDLLIWAGKDPWEFIVTVLMILAPFFLISAFLAYKLSKMIQEKEEADKKATRRTEKIKKKLKRTKAD